MQDAQMSEEDKAKKMKAAAEKRAGEIDNGVFCKNIKFDIMYNPAPAVFVTAQSSEEAQVIRTCLKNAKLDISSFHELRYWSILSSRLLRKKMNRNSANT